MRALAGTLDRARTALGSAASALFLVDTSELPGDLAGAVDAERRSLGSQLSGTQHGLEAGSRYLTRTAEKVEHLDDSGFFSSTGTGVKIGDAIFGEIADLGLHKKDRAGRARRWAGALGALTGTSALGQAAGWQEWGATARKLASRKEWRSATAVQRMSQVLDERIGGGLRNNYGARTPSSYGPDAGKGWRRAGSKVAGGLPYAGVALDVHTYLSDGEKVRRDEPQTGISQVATDVRDVTALIGSSNHVAADVWMLAGPVGVPGAAINEGIGYAADGLVLAMDGTVTVAKGVASAGGDVVKGIEGAGDWAGKKISGAFTGAFG
jgi:hypothetical protein